MNQCKDMSTCILNTTLPTLQGTSEHATIQGWGGVEDVLWIGFTLFVRFFDKCYVATIPKSRFEVLDSFLIFLFPEFLEGVPYIVILHI